MKEKYGRSYFHGLGSNYFKMGYRPSTIFSTIVDFVIFRKGCNLLLLDVGCAYGFLVKIACEKGLDAYGLDVSSYAINRGQEINASVANRLFIGKCERAVAIFGEDRFDIITALEVVEHLPKPEQALASLHNSLKMGGFLLITTPARRRQADTDETHISAKPLSEWIYLLKRLGFHVKAPYFFQHRMTGRGSLKRMFNWGLSHRMFSEALRIIIGYICMLKSADSFILAIKEPKNG